MGPGGGKIQHGIRKIRHIEERRQGILVSRIAKWQAVLVVCVE